MKRKYLLLVLFFILAIFFIINTPSVHAIMYKILDTAFPEEPQSAYIKQLSRWFLGFNEIHEALGWILEKRAPNSTI